MELGPWECPICHNRVEFPLKDGYMPNAKPCCWTHSMAQIGGVHPECVISGQLEEEEIWDAFPPGEEQSDE